MSFQTKDDTTDQEIKIYPITDAHMHIQGNQIAPIPIMKGVLFVQLSTMLCEELLNGQINFDLEEYKTVWFNPRTAETETARTDGNGHFAKPDEKDWVLFAKK